MTLYIVRTQAALSQASTKLYHINPRRDEFKVQDNAVLLQIVQLYITSMFLSCFLPPLWFDISFGGIHSPTLLARQTWLTAAGGQRAVFSPRESKSPPRSTVPKSLTQKTGLYVFGSGAALRKTLPNRRAWVPANGAWDYFPRETESSISATSFIFRTNWHPHKVIKPNQESLEHRPAQRWRWLSVPAASWKRSGTCCK